MSQELSADRIARPPAAMPLEGCPLNHGLAVVDQLLAAITREGPSETLDTALDFRLLLASSTDPAAVLRGFFALRQVVQERHYLACYRLRRWLEKRYVAFVLADRAGSAERVALNLNVPSFGALYARCVVVATDGEPPRAWARVHFAFVEPATVAEGSRRTLPAG